MATTNCRGHFVVLQRYHRSLIALSFVAFSVSLRFGFVAPERTSFAGRRVADDRDRRVGFGLRRVFDWRAS